MRAHLTAAIRAVCLVLALLVCSEEIARPQDAPGRTVQVPQARRYFFKEADVESEYKLFVSQRYRPGVAAPLIVALHGSGSNPDEIIHVRGLLATADERGYVVVAPMGLNPFGGFGSRGPGRSPTRPEDPENAGALSELDVLHVVEEVEREFTIDRQRVFLFGHSMGGAGALYLATTYPERWAGMALFAPGSRNTTLEQVTALKNVRTILYQGKEDSQVLAANSRRLAALMRRTVTAFEYHEQVGDHFSIIAWSPQNILHTFDFFERRGPLGQP